MRLNGSIAFAVRLPSSLYDQTILTNSQLNTAYSNAQKAQAEAAAVMLVSGIIGASLGLSLPETAGTCASNAGCLQTIDEMFDGTSTISDDAMVAVHPSLANTSILENGLSPAKAGSLNVFVTRMQYIRDLGLEAAADNLGVDSAKWLSQPVTLWEVENTSQNMGNLQPYFGIGWLNTLQWASSAPLSVIQHIQLKLP